MLVVNLFGAPGAGKSTVAADLFSRLKRLGYNCELIMEYAKRCVWWGREHELLDQNYICAKQHHKMFMMKEKVEIIITDSPLLLSLLYTPDNYPVAFTHMVKFLFNDYNNLNVYLNRTHQYQSEGRLQSEAQADVIADRTKQMLYDYDVPFHDIDTDKSVLNISSLIIKTVKPKHSIKKCGM